MAQIVVTEFISLDGVVQAPGGEEFVHRNWMFAASVALMCTGAGRTARSGAAPGGGIRAPIDVRPRE